MSAYIKSSPAFFRLILVALVICTATLLILAAFIPAPLQEQGAIGVVPNPVKSAWFLLWIQEIVSYDKRLIYGVAGLALFFVSLPWLPFRAPLNACWMQRELRAVSVVSVIIFIIIVILTVIAMFFRGENWALILSF